MTSENFEPQNVLSRNSKVVIAQLCIRFRKTGETLEKFWKQANCLFEFIMRTLKEDIEREDFWVEGFQN